jgi:AraC-like DNA-binding protein
VLVAHGRRSLGATHLRWSVAFARHAWFKVVECDGIALDTRFVPGAPGPPKPHACLLIVLRGRFQAHDDKSAPRLAPVAIPLTLEQLEGAEGKRPFTFRSDSNPSVIELHVADAHAVGWPRPGSIDLDEAAYEAARRALSSMSASDDAGLADALRDLLRHLSRLGLLTAAADETIGADPPNTIARFWGALKPVVERLAVSSTLDSLGSMASLSSGQVDRAVQRVLSTFGIVGGGVRSLAYHVRLKAAVLFLSAPDAAVGEVAKVVGYGSADALGRAFRDAGLPSPREVQKQLEAVARTP